jgi:hypothetical protein
MNVNSDDSQAGSVQAKDAALIDIRHLTALQLAHLGVAQLAYIKRIPMEDGFAFAIHAADGTPMALAADCDLAAAAIRQHDMVAALVH